MTKKLAEKAAGTASWVTNVGNEYGQMLMSVLTDTGDGLQDMAEGLMNRYKEAEVSSPQVLYVDRDCCSQRMNSKFYQWENMQIRLDTWHFLRRFAAGCSSESHALYSTFMSQLSACVFKWDPEDLERCHFYLFSIYFLFFVVLWLRGTLRVVSDTVPVRTVCFSPLGYVLQSKQSSAVGVCGVYRRMMLPFISARWS